jgi:hypothetical protein
MVLDIYAKQEKVYSKNLGEVLKALYNRYPSGERQAVPIEELTFDSHLDSLDVRLILTNIEGNLADNLPDTTPSGYFDGYILLKMRE